MAHSETSRMSNLDQNEMEMDFGGITFLAEGCMNLEAPQAHDDTHVYLVDFGHCALAKPAL